eukprot:55729_1
MAHLLELYHLYLFLIFIFSIISFIIIVKCIKNLLCQQSIQVKDKKVIVAVRTSHKSPKLKKQPQTISYRPFIRYATLCTLISYFITDIAIFINFILYAIQKGHAEFGRNALGALTVLSWLVAKILMSSLFVCRLKYSFVNTIWMYNTSVFVILYSLLGIISILTLILIVLTFFLPNENYNRVYGMMLRLLILLHSIFQIVLMNLYQRRLFQLIRSYCVSFLTFKRNQQTEKQTSNLNVDDVTLSDGIGTRTHTDVSMSSKTNQTTTNIERQSSPLFTAQNVSFALMDSVSPSDNDGHHNRVDELVDLKVNKPDRYSKVFAFKKLELINTITQYTILFSVSVAFSLSVFITFFQMKWSRTFRVFVLAANCFIDSCCLYAHFSFGIRSYRFCCVRRLCLHNLCVSCFAKCINKSIK